ncbi:MULTISPECIES: ATP-grasp domain-containing protein [Yersinia]|uniref:ATP-grasp domain-containing protein n=1 Tax=Yersinia TaxID=629 RepID=UPI0009B71A0B|nr:MULTISPECIES: ATP-grasp domain-containing protein [Yersinia]ARB82707.1 ATP-grasp domain-containing protein [Yersinia sp. FDAARGOS_228]AVL36438.1 ATP-grasp domain-containing protein [Yersinia intermedia]
MKNIFLQIGATRDGQNPYCAVAQRQGYFTVLIEMGDFIDYQSLCVSLPFDMILPVNHPENPVEVLQAYMSAGFLQQPRVVLAGFEAYNQSAGRVRAMVSHSPDHHSFIPLDKYAQRMALKKASAACLQPDFRFFSSVPSIKSARDVLAYPCVIKPVDGGGGLGIWLVTSPEDLDAAINKLATTMNYGGRSFSGFIVESYLQGEEYSLQGVVCNGQPWALTCCQKVIEITEHNDGNISFYESGHVAIGASQLPGSFVNLMRQCCETFDYRQGAFHIDFIVVQGVPYFLEMGFRLSGMGVVNLVRETTGLNWAEIAFNIEQGKSFEGIADLQHSHAVGQLRLRQVACLSAAELWVHQNQRGRVLPPVHFPQLNVTSESTLYADLTRHAGILGTLRLTASDRQEILTVFHSLMAKTQVSARGGMQCAE